MSKEKSLLKEAQAALNSEGSTRRLHYILRVRNRLRPDRWSGGDILVDISIGEAHPDQRETRLIDVLTELYTLLLDIVDKIKRFFDAERRRFLCFWSLTAESLTAPLFTGGMSLDDPDIVPTLLEYFFKVLLSSQQITLGEQVSLHCTVVGLEHQISLQQRRKRKPPPMPPSMQDFYKTKRFGRATGQCVPQKDLYPVPTVIKRLGPIFDGLCLLISFTQGYLINKAAEPNADPQIMKHLKHLNAPNKPLLQEKAALYVLGEAQQLLNKTGVSLFDAKNASIELLKQLCQFNDCQVLIYSQLQYYTLTFVYPVEAVGLMRIYLFESSNVGSETLSHLDTLARPLEKAHIGQRHICCLYPTQRLGRHTCVLKHCKKCGRKTALKNSYFNALSEETFCGRQLIRDSPKLLTCPTCPKTLGYNLKCASLHRQRCQQKLQCPDCHQFVYGPPSKKYADRPSPSLQKRFADHNCNTYRCGHCRQPISASNEEAHHCKMNDVKATRYIKRLCVWDLECVKHPETGQFEVISVAAMFSQFLHGAFCRLYLALPEFEPNIGHCNLAPFHHMFDYVPQPLGNRVLTAFAKNKVDQLHYPLHSPQLIALVENETRSIYAIYRRNLRRYVHLPKDIRCNPLFHFLVFFHQPYFHQTSFYAHGGQRFDHIFLIKIISTMGLPFRVLNHGAGYMLVAITGDICLHFLDSNRLLTQALAKLPQRFALRETKGFFPHSGFGYHLAGYVGRYLPLSAYTNLSDNASIVAEKRTYLASKKGQMVDYNALLYIYNQTDVSVCLYALLIFTLQILEIQDTMRHVLQTPLDERSINYLWPLQLPVLSISSLS